MRGRHRDQTVCTLSKPIGARPSRGAATAIPWGVVGMIGLIVVIECFVGSKLARFHRPGQPELALQCRGRPDGITRLRTALPGG